LARPPPQRANATPDGTLALEWDVLGLVPGGAFSYQLRLAPLAPGDHALETRTTYRSAAYAYAGSSASPHRVAAPG
ncbi:MAG TPA: hypothetical protein VNX21_00345, partial [Candidatus Thermoplasmatota archaeon]|nr:hypothetical protein [Candidatus Thermoplasmatota archaeon]